MFLKRQMGVLGPEYSIVVANYASTGSIAVRTLVLANVQSSSVEVDLHFVRDGVSHSILTSAQIPAGKNLIPFLGVNPWMYLEAGDILEARCSTEGGVHFLCSWDSNDLEWVEVSGTFTYAGTTITLSDYFVDGPKRLYIGDTGENMVVPSGYNYAVFINSQGEVSEESVEPGQTIQFRSAIVLGRDDYIATYCDVSEGCLPVPIGGLPEAAQGTDITSPEECQSKCFECQSTGEWHYKYVALGMLGFEAKLAADGVLKSYCECRDFECDEYCESLEQMKCCGINFIAKCSLQQTCCEGDETNKCCDEGETCCTDRGAYCCEEGKTCCSGACCEEGQTCCESNEESNCCSEGETCFNGTCCGQGTTYCGLEGWGGSCCLEGETCCNGACCEEGKTCCTGDQYGNCCAERETCCSGACCEEGQTCCERNGLGRCCLEGEICCNGYCSEEGQTCCETDKYSMFCLEGETCCIGDDSVDCCVEGETCCNGDCCEEGKTCCLGDRIDNCCSEGETCFNGTCCGQGTTYCEGDKYSSCCLEGETCFNGTCCGQGTTYCEGDEFSSCCPEGRACCDGVCCEEGHTCSGGYCVDDTDEASSSSGSSSAEGCSTNDDCPCLAPIDVKVCPPGENCCNGDEVEVDGGEIKKCCPEGWSYNADELSCLPPPGQDGCICCNGSCIPNDQECYTCNAGVLVTGIGENNSTVYACCPEGSTGVFPFGDARFGRCCGDCTETSDEEGEEPLASPIKNCQGDADCPEGKKCCYGICILDFQDCDEQTDDPSDGTI